jgi:hypothetical protein
MKKKILFLMLAVLMILPASVFAIDLIGFRVGPTAMLNAPINPENLPEDFFGNLSIDDFSFGVDARFNLAVFEVNALALVDPLLNESDELVGALVKANVGAGVSIALLDMVRLGLFAGPSFAFTVADGDFIPGPGFPMGEDDLFASNLFLRAAVDVMLGGISVGATYIVDTNTNLNNIFLPGFDPATLLDNVIGKAGVSVLFEVF